MKILKQRWQTEPQHRDAARRSVTYEGRLSRVAMLEQEVTGHGKLGWNQV